jgi:hypothetical protein
MVTESSSSEDATWPSPGVSAISAKEEPSDGNPISRREVSA